MSKIEKAGCILLNKQKDSVALVYRIKQKDYSFPKGHMEKGETLKDCALRETEEETGRKCRLLREDAIGKIEYKNLEGDVVVYMYLAIDDGVTDKFIAISDREEIVWVLIEDVEKTLSYNNLQLFWSEISKEITNINI